MAYDLSKLFVRLLVENYKIWSCLYRYLSSYGMLTTIKVDYMLPKIMEDVQVANSAWVSQNVSCICIVMLIR